MPHESCIKLILAKMILPLLMLKAMRQILKCRSFGLPVSASVPVGEKELAKVAP